MNIKKIIQFLFMFNIMLIIGSFYKLDEFRLDITGILVGTAAALILLLWIINKKN